MFIKIILMISFIFVVIITMIGYYILKQKNVILIMSIKEQKDDIVVVELKNNSCTVIKNIDVLIGKKYQSYIRRLKPYEKQEIEIKINPFQNNEDNEYRILKNIKRSTVFNKHILFFKKKINYQIILKSSLTNITKVSTNLLIQTYISMLKNEDTKMLFEKIIDTIISQVTTVIITLMTLSVPLTIYFDSIEEYSKKFLIYESKISDYLPLLPLLIYLLLFIYDYKVKLKKEKIYDCDMGKEIREKRNIKNEIKRRYNINDDEFNEYIEKFK